MSKKGSAPKPPDPQETAAAQTGTNIGSAIANQILGNVNQTTPYGNLTYTQSGSTNWTDPLSGKVYNIPQYTANQTLSPDQQRLHNEQTGAQIGLADLAGKQVNRLGSILGRPVDISGAPDVTAPDFQGIGQGPKLKQKLAHAGPITRTYGDEGSYADSRQRVEDALMARLNPQLEQERERLETQLSNQGVHLGSAAYDRAIENFGKRTNDAQLGAILGAGEEQTRLAGLDATRAAFENSAQGQAFDQLLTRAGFKNDARQQGFQNRMASAGFNNQWGQQGFANDQAMRNSFLQEQYAQRNQPINEIAALLGTGQVQNPNFVNTSAPQVPTVDYAGLVQDNYRNELAAYQQRQANSPWGGIMGGLFSLGSAGIMASDERLKEDIEPVGSVEVPVYEYKYKGDDSGTRHVGVLAQDVAKVKPEAVVPMGKYLGVDYGKLVA